MHRLHNFKISATVLIFGSARGRTRESWEASYEAAKATDTNSNGNGCFKTSTDEIEKTQWMIEMSEKV